MEGISTSNFLVTMLDKWSKDMKDNNSEFDKRVIVKETYRVFVKDGVDEEGKDTYNFTWNGVVFDSGDYSVVVNVRITTTGQKNIDELAPEKIESIFIASLSGIYCTPYDAKNLYNAFGYKYSCQCDECGEFFGDDLDSFVEHLRTKKHKDSIF